MAGGEDRGGAGPENRIRVGRCAVREGAGVGRRGRGVGPGPSRDFEARYRRERPTGGRRRGRGLMRVSPGIR